MLHSMVTRLGREHAQATEMIRHSSPEQDQNGVSLVNGMESVAINLSKCGISREQRAFQTNISNLRFCSIRLRLSETETTPLNAL